MWSISVPPFSKAWQNCHEHFHRCSPVFFAHQNLCSVKSSARILKTKKTPCVTIFRHLHVLFNHVLKRRQMSHWYRVCCYWAVKPELEMLTFRRLSKMLIQKCSTKAAWKLRLEDMIKRHKTSVPPSPDILSQQYGSSFDRETETKY